MLKVFKNKYFNEVREKGHLSYNEYLKLNDNEKLGYLNINIPKKYPNNRGRLIGGYFNCVYCAEADLFCKGYVSEDTDMIIEDDF